MKVCPTCNQTYTDETLNFCLTDGSVLVQKGGSTSNQETVFISQPPPTNPAQPFSNQSSVPNNWGNTPQFTTQPKPKSRTGLWVLGVVGAIVLLCGGGLIGMIALFANNDDDNKNYSANTDYNSKNFNSKNFNSKTNNNGTGKNTLTDDLSDWRLNDESLGKTEFRDGEFYMTSKVGYNFALLTKDKDYSTENATSKVTVRNTTGKAAQYGYGLMVHNNILVALAQDYCFLIDSVNQSYRVAKHQSRKETTVTNWKKFSSIRSGTQENVLEVRDENGKMSFYINGDFVTTVTDTVGIKTGVVGLYVSDALPIAFSNLQVSKN